MYLEALAGENIFKKEADFKKVAKQVKSDSEAIDLGIGFEKDSIIFYTEIKNFVPGKTKIVFLNSPGNPIGNVITTYTVNIYINGGDLPTIS